MGKAGRIACILTPMLLTAASLIAMLFLNIAGWSQNSSSLNSLYLMRADFSNLSVSDTSLFENDDLTAALTVAKAGDLLEKTYEVHLWNYCTANKTSGNIDWCSPRRRGFVFDPVEIWALNSTDAVDTSSNGGNAITSAINNAKNQTEEFTDKVLGKTAAGALNAYKKVAHNNGVIFEIAFWTTLATIVVGILAIFSRWGSLLTWILSFASTILTFAASLMTTVVFSTLTGALAGILKPYDVSISLGTRALALSWIATLLSIFATSFWLMSICCCSGRSNPHHKSNKGGLWNAEPKGQGYGFNGGGRGRGLTVEKTGGGYERVSSPFLGGDGHGDRVPLQQYPATPGQGHGGYGHQQQGGAFEPFRGQNRY
ncbi:hypothetical protein B0A48_02130 [Cryoendolithus antarcticus]|uniref:Integral membrane protein n=1 Tax=Cryoendolithus antarcticus TaxID=1507870 RepID=A0A1V8TMR1_9PEZI|nr:hypothetical protein B0A48_02130 [Cryoendolithus antarcticus]